MADLMEVGLSYTGLLHSVAQCSVPVWPPWRKIPYTSAFFPKNIILQILSREGCHMIVAQECMH